MATATTDVVGVQDDAKVAMCRRDSSGYTVNVFEGKQEQMLKVCEHIQKLALFQKNSFRMNNLGIDDMYFMLESVETIASHIIALYGSKILAFTKSDHTLDVNLVRETDDNAVYIHTSRPGVSQTNDYQPEKRIDEKYMDISNKNEAYRLETYRSSGTVSSSFDAQLRCYFVAKCDFVQPTPLPEEESDIRLVSDKGFLSKATENTLEVYQKVINNVLSRTGPVIEVFNIEGSREKRLVIGYRQRSTQQFFSAMSDLYHYYDLYSSRKYVEQFSNGVTIINTRSPPIEHSIYQVMKEASLIYCLPITPLQSFFQTKVLSVQESIYGYICWIFCQHFLNRLGNEYSTLAGIMDPNNSTHLEVLTKIKKRLRTDTFTREYVLDIIRMYPELVKLLYVNFAMTHYINPRERSLEPTLSYQRLQTDVPLSNGELLDKIRRTTSNSHEFMVFESFLTFNKHVLKTNFYQPTKVAISFRLTPGFLPEIEYPTKPYGMFFVAGTEFRGFHLRFRDVARGGIRVIRSRNREAYSINLRSLFDENYALAATQQRKNKDIPEGGSKGTILLDIDHQDKPRVAFEKYVDAILDLLIEGRTAGIKEKIVDLHKKPEILFFGPDEGTADYMDWASGHARKRGYQFWKAFTTGKSQALGGIPHDLYGMTTRSVHQYVLGIYRKLGLNEEDCTKLQTGGPDGDLGSNEIKISSDKTIGIVDGSGVLYDPEGINREELLRLANGRQMIANFDVNKLGPQGFRVLVDEYKIKLPNGTIIDDGLSFRNSFHLNSLASAQIFVPCGGRPESVDVNNVHELLDADSNPRFKYVVEGANLFFTQEARLRLEAAGAVIFKDAILAALSFNDEDFHEHMQVKAGVVPTFYQNYVIEVQGIIERNAELEFESTSYISDDLSHAIVTLKDELQGTTLWNNKGLRQVVLREALPKLLQEQVGLDTIIRNVPDSRFVYKHGVSPSQFAFFEFMTPYFAKAAEEQV
ncbi:Glutamate/Leucine/Phenylalanine/Valine dehydrogenase-domain-containing protein [Syncephalis fuscata]|nr:Glutamate/Leucine/Phenylalanine/Valine dehydrogenase-domain-containing protein [Syncephalis fuscata]